MAQLALRLTSAGCLALCWFTSLACAPEAPPSADSESATAAADRRRPAGSLTWADDVAPIIHRRCASCHHPGGPGPYSLLTYAEVSKNARQIGEVIASHYMPPWLPEMPGGTFEGERALVGDELTILQQWLREDLRPGDLDTAPAPPSFDSAWPLGPPDLVVEMPVAYVLQEAGRDVFRNFVVAIPNETLRWVRAVDLRPSNPKVIHHATMWIDRTGTSRRIDAEDPAPGYESMDPRTEAEDPDGHFLGWTPGTTPFAGREDLAWRLDPGTDFILQLHMLPSGKEESVRCAIGLYFTDQAPSRVPSILRLGSRTLDIPAGDAQFVITDTYELPVAVEVLALRPHAHYLGRRFEARVTLPDGSIRILLTMPWDFTWQEEYRFSDPPRLPAKTKIDLDIAYDNSEANADNPFYPPQRIRYGPLSSDEMGDLWLQVLTETPADRVRLERHFGAKDLAATIAGFEIRSSLDPDDAAVRIDLGVALEAAGRGGEALEQFQRALALEPGHATVLNNIGSLYQGRGDLEAAERNLRQSTANDPQYYQAHYNLGTVLLARGNLAGAEQSLRAGLALNPGNAVAQNNLGVVLERQGHRDQAVEPFSRAVAMRPDYIEARYNLGLALAGLGDLDRAEEQFLRAVELAPRLAEGHFSLGFIALRRGDFDQAERRFRATLALDPEHANAREGLRVLESQRSSG